MKFSISLLLFGVLLSTVACRAPMVSDTLVFDNLFDALDKPVTACYRIPAIAEIQNGILIAAIDERNGNCGDLRANNDINIVMRRSIDDGKSWSAISKIVDYPIGESASDPSMILDKQTGELFLFFNYMDVDNAPNRYYLKYISSKDNGMSWSEPVDITDQVSKPSWKDDFKFITSGRGIQTRSGILLHTIVNLEKGLHVYGSRDHGRTWFLIDTSIQPGDESKIVELADGTWMINSRVNKSGIRYIHTSDDEGLHWNSVADSTLVDPSCNASIIRYTSTQDGDKKNRLLFCNANDKSSRENLTLRLSYDEGETWKYSKTIYDGKAAYSSVCILKNGDIGILFEKDDYQENAFVSVSLAWLTDGEDSSQ